MTLDVTSQVELTNIPKFAKLETPAGLTSNIRLLVFPLIWQPPLPPFNFRIVPLA